MRLTPGGNINIPSGDVVIKVVANAEIDVSAFCLKPDGKIVSDDWMVFYGKKASPDGSVALSGSGVSGTIFNVNTSRISQAVDKVAFSVTLDGKMVSTLSRLNVQVEHDGEVVAIASVDTASSNESALILGEVYRRNGSWKFRFVSQGFKNGLRPLAEHYGVNIVDDTSPAPAPAPKPHAIDPSHQQGSVRLSKVSLTKASPSVNLSKQGSYGCIKVNLNWNQQPVTNKAGGILSRMTGSHQSTGIDLDLGAFVKTKNGEKYCVQALGGGFGEYYSRPYVQLQGDDRTGANSTGEWLHINGDRWNEIEEVLVYAFIYEGVSNWMHTDGVVTVQVSGQADIETRMLEGNDAFNMCAIARLVNSNGGITVERLDRYFSGHKDMDEFFRWGFRWRAGSK